MSRTAFVFRPDEAQVLRPSTIISLEGDHLSAEETEYRSDLLGRMEAFGSRGNHFDLPHLRGDFMAMDDAGFASVLQLLGDEGFTVEWLDSAPPSVPVDRLAPR